MGSRLSRRYFIGTTVSAAGTLLVHGCKRSIARTALAPTQSPNSLGVTNLRLGFLPQLDAAPLIVAKEKGLFNKYGATGIELVPYDSWQALQSAIVLAGTTGITGAHMPSSLPYLLMAGKATTGERARLYALARLNANGQSIVLANIYQDLKLHLDSAAFKEKVERAKAGGPGMKLKIAVPCVGGTHDLWLRYWLAAGDINPDTDVTIVVVPPAQMVANLQTGSIHAFCVEDPFSLTSDEAQFGYAALTTGELWHNHPEKVFAMRSDWVNLNPKATQAILMAIQSAQIWCDREANRAELVSILVDRGYLQSSKRYLLDRLQGNFSLGTSNGTENRAHRIEFWQNQAGYPYKSHDTWFVTECIRWGYLPPKIDIRGLVNAVNREDLWRQAARSIGADAIVLAEPQSRGVETFFDDRQFDPRSPLTYLNSQPIRKKV